MLATALAIALTLGATSSNPYLERAKRLAEALEFRKALAQLELAEEVPGLERAGKVELHELRARCYIAEGKRREAELAFEQLLATEPSFELPADRSPKILELFAGTKRRVYAVDHFAFRELPSAEVSMARLGVVDPWRRAKKLVLQRRSVGERAFAAEVLGLADAEGIVGFRFEAQRGNQQWYVEAQSADGAVLARLGSAEAPREWLHGLAPVAESGTHPARVELAPTATAAGTAQQAGVSTKEVPPASGGVGRTLGGVGLGVAAAALATAVVFQLNSNASHEAAQKAEWIDETQRQQARSVAQAKWALGMKVGAGAAAVTGVVLLWQL
jgi:tetratricopeptide (TPR) repeat protein